MVFVTSFAVSEPEAISFPVDTSFAESEPEVLPHGVLRDDNITNNKDVDEFLAARLPHYKMEYGVRAICTGQSGLFGKNNRLLEIRRGIYNPEDAAALCDTTPGCTHWSLVSGGKGGFFTYEPPEGLPGRLELCKGEMVSTIPVYTKSDKSAPQYENPLVYMVGVKRTTPLPPRELPNPAALADNGPLVTHGNDFQTRSKAAWPLEDKAVFKKMQDDTWHAWPVRKKKDVLLPQSDTNEKLKAGYCDEGKFIPSHLAGPEHQWPWTRQGTMVGAILGKVPYVGETLEQTVNKIAAMRGIARESISPKNEQQPTKSCIPVAALLLSYPQCHPAHGDKDPRRNVGNEFL
eukprot:gnl/MRDRNA2_/MRDRNA2_58599_c0_seq1.p1 gnl/MRDRNA2_/MRDRNA2_58599_c0~~gnl/MRDRNA2_/MRDRNA2_58599_c0_seq1.p1  ORF type:complete len:347 (+),score=55.45 gnl/MRDRNA2_/MRDRNA2_58599_c0_seq1:150-1190(+)